MNLVQQINNLDKLRKSEEEKYKKALESLEDLKKGLVSSWINNINHQANKF